MPWKETTVVTERMQFVLAVEAEPLESMTVLCARFGISRKTGCKWLKRFEGEGPGGLEDRASRARTISHRLSAAVVLQVLELRKEHPFWGPKQIRARITMERKTAPATSTIGSVLKAYGLVRPRRRRPLKTGGSDSPFVEPVSPNDTWCVDFKGHFLLGDGQRCDPFTLTDQVSRYILKCEGLAHTGAAHVRPHFERAFREFGLPLRMRSDNGPPLRDGRPREAVDPQRVVHEARHRVGAN
jgi:putative transposase